MGFRFRKSINLGGGARLNISKSGIGASAGGKGFRVTKKANGGTRTTISVPGSGVSYVSDSKKENAVAEAAERKPESLTEAKIFKFIFRLLSIVLIFFGAVAAIVEPVFGIAAVGLGVFCWLLARHYKKKIAERANE